jgi:adenosylhomocysteinase
MSVLKLAKNDSKLEPIVYDIEKSQDQEIALAKLTSMGVEIDKLTNEQKKYIQGYDEGT